MGEGLAKRQTLVRARRRKRKLWRAMIDHILKGHDTQKKKCVDGLVTNEKKAILFFEIVKSSYTIRN